MDIGFADFILGMLFASSILWGLIFGFAYLRRKFDEPAHSYIWGFALCWVGTVGFFLAAKWLENGDF